MQEEEEEEERARLLAGSRIDMEPQLPADPRFHGADTEPSSLRPGAPVVLRWRERLDLMWAEVK